MRLPVGKVYPRLFLSHRLYGMFYFTNTSKIAFKSFTTFCVALPSILVIHMQEENGGQFSSYFYVKHKLLVRLNKAITLTRNEDIV